MRTKLGPAWCAAVLLTLTVSGCGLIMSQDDQAKLAKACEGQAVAGAGSYAGGAEGFMVFKRDDDGSDYDYSVDGVHFKLKTATKLEEVHTVFCLEPPEQVDEGTCAFKTVEGVGLAGVQLIDVSESEGPTFPRVSIQRKGRIVDPATGETVAETVVKNAAPTCDSFVGDPIAENFVAVAPSGIAFADWTLGELGVEG